MKHAPLAMLIAALVVVLALSVSRAVALAGGTREPRVCREMTPARMLENPELAEEWAQALRSARPDAIARVRALFAEIRAAHGCGGGVAMPLPAPEDALGPPGHPRLLGPGELPPGHPPIPSSPRVPLFEAPAVLTI